VHAVPFDVAAGTAVLREPTEEAKARATTRDRRSRLIILLPVFALALWASIFAYAHTTHGMTMTADSASYEGIAHNIREGHGPVVPFTAVWDSYSPNDAVRFNGRVPSAVFPPGYPIALAFSSIVAGSVPGAARALDVVLAFLNVVLIGVFTARLTSYRSAIVAAIPPALLLFAPDAWTGVKSPSWLELHTAVLSDAVYITLATATLLALHSALTGPLRYARATTISVAALAGFAFLTRYVGVATVGTVFISFAAFGRADRIRARLLRATIVTAAACIPIVLYLLWIRLQSGNSARPLGVHWLNGIGATFTVFGKDFFPHAFPGWVRTLGIALLLALVTVAALCTPRRVREYWNDERRPEILLRIGLIFVVLSVVALIATRAFFDASIPVDARTLVAARGVAYAIVVAVLYRWLAPFMRQVVVAIALGVLSFGLILANWGIEREVMHAAIGLRIQPTRAERAVAALPPGALIGTNAPDQVYQRSGRQSVLMPWTGIYSSTKPNTHFDEQMREYAAIMTARPSYVYLGITGIVIAPGPGVIGRYMKLRLIAQSGWQVLYKVEPASG
jgi:hypothetical protein